MAARSSTTETRKFASPAVKALMSQRSAELGGLLLGLLGLAILVALVTYDPRDPSLNTATTRHVGNLAGPVGAMLADMLLQGFGIFGALPGVAMSNCNSADPVCVRHDRQSVEPAAFSKMEHVTTSI